MPFRARSPLVAFRVWSRRTSDGAGRGGPEGRRSGINLPSRGDVRKTRPLVPLGFDSALGRVGRPQRTFRAATYPTGGAACPPSASPSSPERPEASGPPPPERLGRRRVRRRACSTSTRPPARTRSPRDPRRRRPRARASASTSPTPRRSRPAVARVADELGAAGRARQQRRHHPRQPAVQDDRGRLGRRDERAPARRVPDDQGLPGAHDRAERYGRDRQPLRRPRRRATAARPTTPPPRPACRASPRPSPSSSASSG